MFFVSRSVTRALSVTAVMVLGGLASNAHAGFVLVDTIDPGSAATAIPGNNDFRTQLASAGVTERYLGSSLSVTGAQAGDLIEIDFFAAEAAYRNQFKYGATTFIDNQGFRSWGERDRGSVAAVDGVQSFRFCSLNVSACLTNAANDGAWLGKFQSIGMYLTDNGTTAWLLWDDSGANVDDDHDDLVVRLKYRAVPEPGTLALLGFGLSAMSLLRRRRKLAA